MQQNKLTVYSNGVTRIQRFVTVEGKTTIDIPVRKAYVSDLLATLGVFGKVKMVEPPSYSNDATKNALKLSPSNVYFDLATKLSGADVKINCGGKLTHGKLAGVNMVETQANNIVTKTMQFIVLANDNTLQTFSHEHIGYLEFTQPEVQRLIQNALAKNFENVRPDSCLVRLVLETAEKTEALLDYAIPTAAWQSVYRLNIGDKSSLQYNAKLDNPTDEDWLATKVSVVVGEPITFDTDLGEVRTPSRAKVNLVSNQAAGPVRAQDATKSLTPQMVERLRTASARGQKSMLRSKGGFESLEDAEESVGDVNYCATMSFGGAAPAAEVSQATAEEVGDFAVFTSQDVIDIRGNMSGVVRLFTEEIEAKEVLFYDYQQDPERAYRGVRFTNTTKNSLGKGVCTVYLNDVLAGQSVLENCKPGNTKTLVFSRENGVTAICKPSGIKPSRMAVGVSGGELWWQDRQSSETVYSFANLRKDAAFTVEINHSFSQDEPVYEVLAVDKALVTEKTKNGLRLTTTLPADGVAELIVRETKLVKSSWKLEGVSGINRLSHFFLASEDSMGKSFQQLAGYKHLMSLVENYNKFNQQIADFSEEAEQLKEEQSRLLELVKSGNTASQLSKWQDKLDKGEDRITEIEKKAIPDRRRELAKNETSISEAFKGFIYDWKK